MRQKEVITVQIWVDAPLDVVWKCWNTPVDIMNWNVATDDWHTPSSTNDLRVGGRFVCRMEAKNGAMGFDFGGTYDVVIDKERIDYTMDDERKVTITFTQADGKVHIVESFEAESCNPIDLQHDGWQAIMDNFKRYTEHQYSGK